MMGPLNYIGGKRRLAKRIVSLTPPHTTYVEPFAGGAQVLFAKPPSEVEVLNDLNDDIVTFFRVCQHHHEELVRYLKYTVMSRSLFALYSKQDPTTLTDVQRAARFLYLQKNAFGGKVRARNFHFGVTRRPNYNLERLPELLDAVATRLSKVQIESRPYEKVLSAFDRDTTFFYCDPPYVGVDFYSHNLEDDDFSRMSELLANIRGKFLLSINDHPVARHAFGRFECLEVPVSYTLSQDVPTVRELLFANYPLRPE